MGGILGTKRKGFGSKDGTDKKFFLFNIAQHLNLIYFTLQCSTAGAWSKTVPEISVKLNKGQMITNLLVPQLHDILGTILGASGSTDCSPESRLPHTHQTVCSLLQKPACSRLRRSMVWAQVINSSSHCVLTFCWMLCIHYRN